MLSIRMNFIGLIAAVLFSNCVSAQNFERYRPQTLTPEPITRPDLQDAPPPVQLRIGSFAGSTSERDVASSVERRCAIVTADGKDSALSQLRIGKEGSGSTGKRDIAVHVQNRCSAVVATGGKSSLPQL